MNPKQLLVLSLGLGAAVLVNAMILCGVSVPLLGEAILGLLLACALVAIGAMYIGSLFWVYADAKRRVKAPDLVTFWVAIGFWPFGLWLWYRMRPEVDESGYYNHNAVRKASVQ